MPGFSQLEERVDSLENTRTNGLGSLTFELDPLLPDTTVPTGAVNWTQVQLWRVFLDTFGAGASVENGGRIQRYPVAYWGDALAISSIEVEDLSAGTANWEFAVALGADLVTSPQTFLFPPLPLSAQDTAFNTVMFLQIPNIARVAQETPGFEGLESFDAAVVGKHDGGGSRIIHPIFARTVWSRQATLTNPL